MKGIYHFSEPVQLSKYDMALSMAEVMDLPSNHISGRCNRILFCLIRFLTDVLENKPDSRSGSDLMEVAQQVRLDCLYGHVFETLKKCLSAYFRWIILLPSRFDEKGGTLASTGQVGNLIFTSYALKSDNFCKHFYDWNVLQHILKRFVKSKETLIMNGWSHS